jgi:hypothetical protein
LSGAFYFFGEAAVNRFLRRSVIGHYPGQYGVAGGKKGRGEITQRRKGAERKRRKGR